MAKTRVAAGISATSVSGLAVPGAFLLANAASYALLLAAAHRLDESQYGVLSSLLGLLLISTVPMLALQTVVARRAAADRGGADEVVRDCLLVAVAAGVVLAAASPALSAFLHLDDVTGTLLVAATVPATAVLGAAMGLAQGRRHFGRLAVLILASTGSRSLGGLAGLLIGDGVDATLTGVLVGTAVAAAVVVAGRDAGWYRTALRDRRGHGVLTESLHAAHAHGTFLLVTAMDVLLARHLLESDAAGRYAVGSVVTRVAVWLPQSVVMLLFASLAIRAEHAAAARRALAAVVALGAVTVAGTAVLGDLVVRIVGGGKYVDLGPSVWRYALLGALLAVVQLCVLAGLARRDPRRAGLLWVIVLADLAVTLGGVGDPTALVTRLVLVAAGAAVVAVVLLLREPTATPSDQPAASDGQAPGLNAGSSPLPNSDATPEATG